MATRLLLAGVCVALITAALACLQLTEYQFLAAVIGGAAHALPAATPSPAPMARLGDGCYHVFIDLGSNRGVHGRFLFEPEKYTNNTVERLFAKLFGTVQERRSLACVFAFEPNPDHNTSQLATEAAYQRMGWRYKYMPAGVSDHNGVIEFYRNPAAGGAGKSWYGFSAMRHDSGRLRLSNPAIHVPVVDFTPWLQDHILERRVPARKDARGGGPKVMIKMDIEGMEIPVLIRMLVTGTACRVDGAIMEMHDPGEDVPLRTNASVARGSAMWYFNAINRLLKDGGCHTWRLLDSEHYLMDGLPLP